MAGNGRSPERQAGPPIPGVVIVWSGETPVLQALRLPSLGLILGRELLGPKTADDRISRQHARVRWNGHAFAITDLGSRNGTYVGGTLVSESEVTVTPPCVLRTGRTVSVLVADVRPYEAGDVRITPDGVVGPRRAVVHEQVRKAAAKDAPPSLLIVGEPGAGVDAAVTIYHHAHAGDPGTLAEVEAARLDGGGGARWWHGVGGEPPEAARAHRGTLVVHDVGQLDADGQAAVAHILQAGELVAKDGHKWPIEARVIATCDPDEVEALRNAVGAGTFRDELWRRLQTRVELPPLRTCCEEIPHWVVNRVREVVPELSVHSTLIEACLLRPWPGNVDELRHEVAHAALAARESGKRTVRGEHLELDAGMLVAMSAGPTTLAPSLIETTRLKKNRSKNALELASVQKALDEHSGDLGRTAIALGVHRNRLRRFIHDNPELAPLVSGDDQHRTAVITDED
jgi:transcriptional regulator of acetoin/glycerol metabolism